MLTLEREAGQTIFLGTRLYMSDLPGTCDYQIDFDVVDHRVGRRRIEVLISDRTDIARHVLTPEQPDLDFAPGLRLAWLSSREYMRGDECTAIAKVGIKAPRNVKILRDDVNYIAAVGRGIGR